MVLGAYINLLRRLDCLREVKLIGSSQFFLFLWVLLVKLHNHFRSLTRIAFGKFMWKMGRNEIVGGIEIVCSHAQKRN